MFVRQCAGHVAQRLEQGDSRFKNECLHVFSQACAPLRALGVLALSDSQPVAHNCVVLQRRIAES